MENEINNQNKKSSGLWMMVVGLMVIIAILAWWWVKRGDNATGTVPVSTLPSDIPVVTTDTRKYKDGTYTAVGNYISPAGKEQVDISITLVDSKITAATFSGEAINPTSKKMQANFKAGFSKLVVGKNIDQISLTVVNGSSLTPKGFMDALMKVKAEATAV